MATSNQRDAKLGVAIETAGQENLRQLTADVRALAKEGTDAAPEYARLANELERLSAEAKTLDSFRKIAADLGVLNAAQQQAVLEAERLRAAYEQQQGVVEPLRAAQAQLRETYDATTAKLGEQRAALATLRAGVLLEGETEDLAALRKRGLILAIEDLKNKRIDDGQALQANTRNLKDAESAEDKLATAAQRAIDSVAAQTRAFQAQAAALEEARAAAARAGQDLSSLDAAEERFTSALQTTVAALEERAALTRETAELDAQAKLAAEQLADRVAATAAAYERDAAALKQTVEAQAAATAEALRYVEAEDAAAAAAERASRAEAELNAQAEKTAQRAAYERDVAAAFEAAAAAALEEAAAVKALDAANKLAADQLADRLVANSAAYERDIAALHEQIDAQARAADEALRFVEAEDAAAAAIEKASRRFAELNAQAEKTKQDEDYVRALAAAFDQVDAQARQATAAVQQLNDFYKRLGDERAAVDAAFGQAGVRSIEAIEREIFNVNGALAELRLQFENGAIGAADLARAVSSAEVRIATLKAEIETIPRLATPFENLAAGINNVINKFGALGAAVATVGFAVKPVLEAEVALQSMQRVLTQVTGSSEEAARQIAFLRQTAQQSGQSFSEIGKSFTSFAVSALQTGLSMKTVDEVFRNVTLAAGNLGLSSDQTKRALEALGQMASKGVVSMEELRQQLGDALPGVLPLLARELGLTDAQLQKLVASGSLLSVEAIPAIGRAIAKLGSEGGAPVQGLLADFTRLKDGIIQAGTVLTETFLGQVIITALFGLGTALKGIVGVLALISAGFSSISDKFSTLAAAVANWDFKNLTQAFKDIDERFAHRVDDIANAMRTASDATNAAAGSVAGLASASAQASKALQANTDITVDNAKSMAALTVAHQKAIDTSAQQAKATEAVVEGVKKEAQAIETLAKITGSDVEEKKAAITATALVAKATQDHADAVERELVSTQRARAEIVQYAVAHGYTAAQVQAATDVYDKHIIALTGAATKAHDEADAATAAAVAAEQAANALKDQSGKYEQFADALKKAETELAKIKLLYDEGRASADRLHDAETALAVAKGNLRKAIDDQVTAMDRHIAAIKLEADYTNSLIKLDIARMTVQRDEALALGNTTEARRIDNQIALLQITITQNSTLEKRLAANETIRTLTLKEQELAAANQLTPAIKAELDQRIRAAQIVLNEADAETVATDAQKKHTDAVIAGTERLAGHTTGTVGNTGAVKDNTGAVNDNTGARNANAGSIDKQTEAAGKYLSILRDQARYNDLVRNDPSKLVSGSGIAGIADHGGANDTGPVGAGDGGSLDARLAKQGGPVDNTLVFALLAKAQAGTLTLDDMPAVQTVLAAAKDNAILTTGSSVPDLGGIGAAGTAQVVQLQRALEELQAKQLLANNYKGPPAPGTAQAGSSAFGGAAGGRTVTININGTPHSMVAGNAAQADAFVTALENAFKLAGGG